MDSVLEFISAVANHWAWAAGGAIAVAVSFYFSWRNKPIPRTILLVMGIAFLLVAFYKTWDGEHKENLLGQDAGTLALRDLQYALVEDPKTHKGDVQMRLELENMQPRLVEYLVDSFSLEIQSVRCDTGAVMANRGGNIPARQVELFRFPFVRGVDLTREPLSGTLSYKISYRRAPGGTKHHTNKKLVFYLFRASTSAPYTRLQDYED